MDSHIAKVNTENLTVGMHVAELDRPWLDSPFLLQGFKLDSEEDVRRMQEVCHYVYIDTLLSSNVAVNNQFSPAQRQKETTSTPASQPRKPPTGSGSGIKMAAASQVKSTSTLPDSFISSSIKFKSPPPPKVTFESEISRAKPTYRHLYDSISVLFHRIQQQQTVDLDSVLNSVAEVVDSIQRNPGAMEWMTQFRDKEQYAVIHALNTCILSIKLGNQIGLAKDKLQMLGRCALLHDIGELKLPQEILQKAGKLDQEEIKLIRRHVSLGLTILHDAQNVPAEIRYTCLSHHERLDGSGYPQGARAERIDMLTRIISLVDVYDALNSERVHTDGISADAAISELYTNKGTHYDERLVEAFIQCMGIYPIGTLVELQGGEVGLVTSTDQHYRLRPTILMVLNSNKKPLAKPVMVNTATHKSGKTVGIDVKQALSPGSYDIHSKDFFD